MLKQSKMYDTPHNSLTQVIQWPKHRGQSSVYSMPQSLFQIAYCKTGLAKVQYRYSIYLFNLYFKFCQNGLLLPYTHSLTTQNIFDHFLKHNIFQHFLLFFNIFLFFSYKIKTIRGLVNGILILIYKVAAIKPLAILKQLISRKIKMTVNLLFLQ